MAWTRGETVALRRIRDGFGEVKGKEGGSFFNWVPRAFASAPPGGGWVPPARAAARCAASWRAMPVLARAGDDRAVVDAGRGRAMRHASRHVTRNATDRARSFPSGLARLARSRLGRPRLGRSWRGRQGHGLGGLGRRRAKLAVPCESAAPPWRQFAARVAQERASLAPCGNPQPVVNPRTGPLAQGEDAATAFAGTLSVAMG